MDSALFYIGTAILIYLLPPPKILYLAIKLLSKGEILPAEL